MNILKLLFIVVFPILFFPSCQDDTSDNRLYPNALVTIKQTKDKTCYLQLDDIKTLYPINLKSSPFGNKEVRALVNYKEVNQSSFEYRKAVYINWIDSILTKELVQNMGSQNDSIYGNDPVEIIPDWVTIAEDGYLTLRFRSVWGNINKTHFVNLISEENSNNPYQVEFRHNPSGDVGINMEDALVAFNTSKLPDTKGKMEIF